MAIMKKVLFKVDHNGEQEWVHFCYVPADVSDRFFSITGKDRQGLAHMVEKWVFQDYQTKVSIDTYEDIQRVRDIVTRRFRMDYSELYVMGDKAGDPSIFGIVRMWLVQHMRMEIAKYELNGEAK